MAFHFQSSPKSPLTEEKAGMTIKTMRRINVFRLMHILFVLAVLSGCGHSDQLASPSRPQTPVLSRSQSEQEIYLTIWHEMFAHWKGAYSEIPKKFFLSKEGHDVATDLLAQFRRERYDVSPGSKYQHGRGIHCSVEKVEWVSPSEAKVFGGYLFGPLGGEWGYFILKHDKGKWAVISWKPHVFS